MFVNGARDQILADAGFAADEDGGVGGRDALDEAEHSLHFIARRDDVLIFVAAAQRLAQVAIFFAQGVGGQLLADDENELGERKRFEDVIAGARLHGVDGGLDGAVGGHHDDRNAGVDTFERVEKFEAGHAGELEIGDDDIGGVLAEDLQGGFGVGCDAGLKTFLGELELEEAAHLGFVFDDEYGRFFALHISRASGASVERS